MIGLGSMGRRRTRLLKEYDSTIEVLGVDSLEQRRLDAEEEFGIKTYQKIDDAVGSMKCDAAFICSSPLSHAEIISECLRKNLHVFTEINLHSKGYEVNLELAREKGKILFLSSTLLYRKEIQYIKKIVSETDKKLTYHYHVGQYLPNWHPWENYKNFFVGKKETNGCREFMAIDFPWVLSVFGKVRGFSAVSRKNSSLDLPYDDTYFITLEHEKAVGQIIVDVVSPKAVRNLEISGENMYLTWDGTPFGLKEYDTSCNTERSIKLYESINKRKDYNSSIIEDAYLEEIINFFNVIKGKEKPLYSFEEDMETISLIDSIEKDGQKHDE